MPVSFYRSQKVNNMKDISFAISFLLSEASRLLCNKKMRKLCDSYAFTYEGWEQQRRQLKTKREEHNYRNEFTMKNLRSAVKKNNLHGIPKNSIYILHALSLFMLHYMHILHHTEEIDGENFNWIDKCCSDVQCKSFHSTLKIISMNLVKLFQLLVA